MLEERCVLTARHSEGADLAIQRVELQVHGTGEREGYSDAVQDGSVREDAYVDVGHDDVVEVAFFLVGEEEIRHPDSVGFC